MDLQPLILLAHIAGVAVWVGGMIFAYFFLRPAAAQVLEPPQRLRLWSEVLGRFFAWVNVAVVLVVASGLTRLGEIGMASAPSRWHLMLATGLSMAALYAYVRVVPYRALAAAVAAQDWKAAGAALAAIRRLVAVNIALGVVTITSATVGRWFF